MIQMVCRFSLQDKIRLNFSTILGTKMNNGLENCLNKAISFNREITTIYI
jgi:hypothetical protein